MVRKTAKYYREQLKTNPTEEIVKEVLIKYGKRASLNKKFDNHTVAALSVDFLGNVIFEIYYKENDYNKLFGIDAKTIKSGHVQFKHIIKGEEVVHDLYFQPDEYRLIIDELINYLSPKAIKERKVKCLKTEAGAIVRNALNGYYDNETASELVNRIDNFVDVNYDGLLLLNKSDFKVVIIREIVSSFKIILAQKYLSEGSNEF